MFNPYHNRRGMVLYLILIIAAFAFLLVSNLVIINHGEMNQLTRTENIIRCEIATRSVFQEIAGELRVKPWSKRSFKDNPKTITGITDDKIKYTAVIENSENQDRQADIWIATEENQAKRVVFYRVNVNYSVFQKMNEITPVFFSFLNPDKYGNSGEIKNLKDRVDKVITKRIVKNAEKEIFVKEIQNCGTLVSVMKNLGIPLAGESAQLQSPFSNSSTVGYAQTPFEMFLGEIDTEAGISEGKISLNTFSVVKKRQTKVLSNKLISRLKNSVGKNVTAKVIDSIERMNIDPTGGSDILLSDNGEGTDVTDNIIGTVIKDKDSDNEENVAVALNDKDEEEGVNDPDKEDENVNIAEGIDKDDEESGEDTGEEEGNIESGEDEIGEINNDTYEFEDSGNPEDETSQAYYADMGTTERFKAVTKNYGEIMKKIRHDEVTVTDLNKYIASYQAWGDKAKGKFFAGIAYNISKPFKQNAVNKAIKKLGLNEKKAETVNNTASENNMENSSSADMANNEIGDNSFDEGNDIQESEKIKPVETATTIEVDNDGNPEIE